MLLAMKPCFRNLYHGNGWPRWYTKNLTAIKASDVCRYKWTNKETGFVKFMTCLAGAQRISHSLTCVAGTLQLKLDTILAFVLLCWVHLVTRESEENNCLGSLFKLSSTFSAIKMYEVKRHLVKRKALGFRSNLVCWKILDSAFKDKSVTYMTHDLFFPRQIYGTLACY